MKNLFLTLQKLAWFIREHFAMLLISSLLLLGTLAIGVRIFFPEMFEQKYVVTYSGDDSVPFEKLPALRAERKITPNTFTPFLQNEFGLPNQIGDTFFSASSSASILLNPTRDVALYTNSDIDVTASPPSLSQGEAVARRFLQNLGYQSELKLERVEYYRSEGIHYDISTPEEATVIAYYFLLQQNGVPLNATSDESNTLEVFVAKDGVVTARLRPLFFTLNAQENKDIKSVQEALQELALGKFQSTQFPASEERVGTFALTQKELIYLLDEATQVMIPTFRFTGTYKNPQGQTLPVEVYVNAIE